MFYPLFGPFWPLLGCFEPPKSKYSSKILHSFVHFAPHHLAHQDGELLRPLSEYFCTFPRNPCIPRSPCIHVYPVRECFRRSADGSTSGWKRSTLFRGLFAPPKVPKSDILCTFWTNIWCTKSTKTGGYAFSGTKYVPVLSLFGGIPYQVLPRCTSVGVL